MNRVAIQRAVPCILILPALSSGAPGVVVAPSPIRVTTTAPDSRGAEHALTPADHKRVKLESAPQNGEVSFVGCGPACDFCWFGTAFELDCDPNWEDDGACDCGCQFPDTLDCGLPECEPHCEFCHLGTVNENNCPSSWDGDGECDCGCQFSDAIDCATGGGSADLVIQNDIPFPTVHTNPGYSLGLDSTAYNQGTGPANAAFDMTWFISLDPQLSPTLDFPWAFVTIDCCLPTEVPIRVTGAAPRPDVAPFNTPGVTYYFSVMVDDTFQVAESNELNNWGRLFQLTLCQHTGDLSGDFLTDADDYTRLAACLLGPETEKPEFCLCADDDNDTDVDLQDVATFLNALDLP